jgi:hypothetical protein
MGEAPAWRFAAGHLKANADGTIAASNHGGEFHTFGEVAVRGRLVPETNRLLGLDAVPECLNDIFPNTGVPAGGSRTTGPLGGGTNRFPCLVHPWQRTTAQPR